MRGVVEKCNFCHGRWHAAKQRAAATGKKDIDPADYVPACVEACPTGAIQFGDLNDKSSEAAQAAALPESFRLLEKLRTDPKIYYRSNREWVRKLADAPQPGGRRGNIAVERAAPLPSAPKETPRG
jgi:molybdopterin-containing oxidoreductase family iron-sulfur binding subunit